MPRPFVTSLLKSGAKCYVLQPMGKAKIMHQKQILKVIDQWAADNKAKSIMISKGGIYDSTRSKTRWSTAQEPPGTKHISILASTTEDFDRKQASPYHLYVVDPDAEDLDYKGDRAGSTEPRDLRDEELQLIKEAEDNVIDIFGTSNEE